MEAETVVDQTMILSGDRVKLRELLIVRLNESGWVDEVRLMCRRVLQEEEGVVPVDSIVEQVTPMARKTIPDEIKKELLSKIKSILMANYKDIQQDMDN